ncbi:MAG: 50S ribosomal protein L10 [Candidatus Nanoarchaeia archaeon]|nr:50S ribosomal protein L10 [Candidatus Nanoarchaeia archaeon]
MTKKIQPKKKQEVENIKKLIAGAKVFGIADMTNLPALQLQRMKEKLRGKVVVRMSKKRLIKIALDGLKDKVNDVDSLKEKIRGMPALVLCEENPFKLYKELKREKSSAPAKAGQIAPNDIYIKKGKTSFAPGPIIGELGQIGIRTGVEEGKVAVQEDKLVVKAGEVIKQNVADVLTKLKIEPMEVGINLLFAYDNGTVYERAVLDVDEEQIIKDIQNIHRWSLNLAVYAGIYSKETVEVMIRKAELEVKALGSKVNIQTPDKTEEAIKTEEEKVKEVEDMAKKVMWGEAGGEIQR